MSSMREFRLRDDLERLSIDGYALPLGVERLDAPPPQQGWVVEFVPGEDDAPDTYSFQITVSHERLQPLVHTLFDLLPDDVGPVVEIGSVDAYRSIDTYLASRPIFKDDFLSTWVEFEPILLEEVSIGIGATSEEPFLEVFIDPWKSISVHCQVGMRDEIEAILDRFGLEEVVQTWDESAFDAVEPPYRMREILVIEDEHSPDLDELLLQLREDWGLQLDVDPHSNLDDGGRELGFTLWHAIAMADPLDERIGGAYVTIWATARSLEEAQDLIEAAVEGSGDWLLDRLYSIERVAFDERPEELAELAPRRDGAEVHLIHVDEWGDGEPPPEPVTRGGREGGRERLAQEDGFGLWRAIVMVTPLDERIGGAFVTVWTTARSSEEAQELIESAVEGSGKWALDRLHSIERMAFDQRPEELAKLSPRRDRAEVHLIHVDEFGEGDPPPEPGDRDWGTPGGRLS